MHIPIVDFPHALNANRGEHAEYLTSVGAEFTQVDGLPKHPLRIHLCSSEDLIVAVGVHGTYLDRGRPVADECGAMEVVKHTEQARTRLECLLIHTHRYTSLPMEEHVVYPEVFVWWLNTLHRQRSLVLLQDRVVPLKDLRCLLSKLHHHVHFEDLLSTPSDG